MVHQNIISQASLNLNPLSSEDEDGEVCISNISLEERKKRLWFGIRQFIVSLAILIALVVFGVDRWWRLPLLLPFWAAAIGYFQARDKT